MTKRHSYHDVVLIGELKFDRDKYKINKTYQRELVWSIKDMQYFIDSIIQDYPIPQVYIRKIPEGVFEIVDGQQRLTTIWDFLGDRLPVSKDFSDPELKGKKYSSIPERLRIKIDSRKIPVIWLENYNDEDVRSLFRRLQAGKELNTAEKLNAFPGSITNIARKLAEHKIFSKVGFSLNRFRALQLTAQVFLLVNEGITDIGASYLYNFFDYHKDATEKNKFFRESKRTLNFMNKVIIDSTMPEIHKPSWFINFFVFTKEISDKYVVIGKEKVIHKFYSEFYTYIQKNKKLARNSREKDFSIDMNAIQFVNYNRAGTNNRKSIQYRCDLLVSKFLEWHQNIELKDKQRQFDEYQRIAIYRRDKGICQLCNNHIDFNDFQADHITPHSKGGFTIVSNGQTLCSKCNLQKSNI